MEATFMLKYEPNEFKTPTNTIEYEIKSISCRNSFVEIICEQDDNIINGTSAWVTDIRNRLAERDKEVCKLTDKIDILSKTVFLYKEFLSMLKDEVVTLNSVNERLKYNKNVRTTEKHQWRRQLHKWKKALLKLIFRDQFHSIKQEW